MNQHYHNRYLKFIDALKNQSIDGYSEKHHIVPRSMGGGDEPSNIIVLTLRQHYVAHWMLWKVYGGKMAVAFDYMNGIKKYGYRLTGRTIKLLSEDVSKRRSERPVSDATKDKQRQAKLGRKLSAEHIEKVRQASIGRTYSEETKRKVSEAKKGISTRGTGWSQSEETRNKIGQAQVGALNHMHGRKHSMETRMKMKEAHRLRHIPISAEGAELCH
jgi:hypothetical protein